MKFLRFNQVTMKLAMIKLTLKKLNIEDDSHSQMNKSKILVF
jgi:hypothetical protein